MSAPLLKYPHKPPEVSDDMESFIYSMFFCILRYQHTSLTEEGLWALKPPADTFNRLLAKFVSEFFYQEIQIGDLYYGGNGKLSAYTNPIGLPPFTVLEETSALAELVSALHEICFRHFHSIDYAALAQYDPRIKSKMRKPLAPLRLTEGFKFAPEIPYLPVKKPMAAPPLKEAPPAMRPSDPLANHSRLHNTLLNILNDPTAQWGVGDKTPDQFEGLPTLGYVHDKAESFDVSIHAGGKRKASNSGRLESKKGRS